MKIWLRIHGFELCSWTFVWDNLKEAFEAQGDEIWFSGVPDKPEEWVEVWWGDPQFWEWSNLPVKAKIAIALSEAHSILKHGRETVISNLNQANMIICPSEFSTIAFRESPINTPIKVVWFGVDPKEFSYTDRNWDGEFRFLHAGVTQFRKGSWMVPEAFVQSFSELENVKLTIATPKITDMFTRLKHEYGNHPNIEFICEMQDSSMDLYSKHHAYVSPHLSEGFGLMIPEAMATGMPCLVSRCSSPREFFDDKYGWWIEMSEEYAPVFQCLPETNSYWRLPGVESLGECMGNAVDSRGEAKEKGKLGSEYVNKFLTWDICVTKIKKIIKEVVNENNYSDPSSV